MANIPPPILVGKAVTTPEALPDTGGQVFLQPNLANRHGLVAGATGTGKTVTLMTLAEGFSRIGVPVFMADVKGDVAGLAMPGTLNDKLKARIEEIGIAGYVNEGSPVVAGTPEAAAQAAEPQVVDVALSNFVIEMPDTLPAGPTRFAITNIARSVCASVRWPHWLNSRLKFSSLLSPS